MINRSNFHSSRVIAIIKTKVDYHWTEIKCLTFMQKLNTKLQPAMFILSFPCHNLIALLAQVLKMADPCFILFTIDSGRDGRK